MIDPTQFDLRAKIGFSNDSHLTVVYWPFARADGTVGIQSRAVLKDGVTVVALDKKTHEVFVIEQKRDTGKGPITVLECPGGGIDGSNPFTAAKAELLEEAGVIADDDDLWVALYGSNGMCPMDGLVSTRQHAFLVLAARKIQDPSDPEILRVRTFPLSTLIEMDTQNEFHDPLVGYKLYRADAWLRKNRRDLLT